MPGKKRMISARNWLDSRRKKSSGKIISKPTSSSAVSVPESSDALKALTTHVKSTSVLLDCSGSMNRVVSGGATRFSLLKKVVKQLENYPFRKYWFCSYISMTPPNIARGSTYLFAAIRHAYLDSVALKKDLKRIIIVSDGEPKGKSDTVEKIVGFVQEKDIILDVCFIGDPMSKGEYFLTEIARKSGGSFKKAKMSIKSLPEVTGTITGFLPGGAKRG